MFLGPRSARGKRFRCIYSSSGQSILVRLLLEYGANPEIKDWSGQTALHHTARGGTSLLFVIFLKEKLKPMILHLHFPQEGNDTAFKGL